jgi:glucose-6-phosphate-specific signal transduction histidine kinase
MKTSPNRFLVWTPRILCLLFAGFISVFALDVFEENRGFWNTMLALLMHLIPTGILLLILALSWRWEWIGGLLCCALGAFYIIAFRGRFHWSVYAIIAGPLFLVGVLFLLSWKSRRQARKGLDTTI